MHVCNRIKECEAFTLASLCDCVRAASLSTVPLTNSFHSPLSTRHRRVFVRFEWTAVRPSAELI